ncbi:MAG: hypothetical protein JSV34_04425 [Candidatus Omnitrophota bacterium]|nr:MAG: hypothetical protein JSV34_04425 [Candidatus Omnitrophota bacterium]
MVDLKEKNVKIILILFIFLLLDLLRPFGYFIHTEFLFLGIILLSLNYPFLLSLVLSIIFGYLKDALSYGNIPLNLIEFSCIAIFIHYFLYRFNKKIIRLIVFFMAIIIHVFFNVITTREFNFIFSLWFFMHSVPMFLLINYLSKKWVKTLSAEYI